MKKRSWIDDMLEHVPERLLVALGVTLIIACFTALYMVSQGVIWPILMICAIDFVSCTVFIAILIIESIYRKLTYNYTIETMQAEVTGKQHEVYPRSRDGHYVDFRTDNNLLDTIDDLELYDWAEKGRRFKVTLKIGRTRGANPEPRCWTVLDYSFHK